MARCDYSRASKENSVSKLFLCPFFAVEAWATRRAAQAISRSRESKRNTFLSKRRRNQGLHRLEKSPISLPETCKVSEVWFYWQRCGSGAAATTTATRGADLCSLPASTITRRPPRFLTA